MRAGGGGVCVCVGGGGGGCVCVCGGGGGVCVCVWGGGGGVCVCVWGGGGGGRISKLFTLSLLTSKSLMHKYFTAARAPPPLLEINERTPIITATVS